MYGNEAVTNTILDYSRDAIILVDANRWFITGTKENLQKLGFNTQNMPGRDILKSLAEVMEPETYERISTRLKNALKTGEAEEYRAHTRFKDNRSFDCECAIIPFKCKKGTVLGAMIQVHNIREL